MPCVPDDGYNGPPIGQDRATDEEYARDLAEYERNRGKVRPKGTTYRHDTGTGQWWRYDGATATWIEIERP